MKQDRKDLLYKYLITYFSQITEIVILIITIPKQSNPNFRKWQAITNVR